MPKLADYSGKFDPEFSHDKFKRETLIKLLKAYGEYLVRIDGYWYLTVMNKLGNDVAFDCDVNVWEGKLLLYDLKLTTSALNIHGDNVVTVMKYMQASPWTWVYEMDLDIKNDDHAIVTYHTCPTLAAIEQEGTGREKLICQDLDTKLYGMIAHYFNPNIKVTGLKVPPRTSYSDCCCQWEYKLDR
jgi:hypothetical protein